MNKYEIRTQNNKNAIIHAALTLFKDKGYTNVSILEIAALSGVSSVSIYNYFNNKEGLVRECANVLMEETIQIAREVLLKKIPFKEKLLEAASICAEKNQQLLGEYFSSQALNDKAFVDLYTEHISEIKLQILKEFIECGKEEGAIDPSISTQTIMKYIEAIEKIHISLEGPSDYKTQMDELYKLLLYGLIGHPCDLY